jgi:hypothetical protein
VAVTAGAVWGRAPLDPVLEVELKIQADGFAPGVAAMILASCHVLGARLQADLGQAETIVTQLGFSPRDGGDTPYTTRVFARWRLTQAGVEYLERVRDGGNVAVYVTPEVVLLNRGESLPGLYPRPEGVHRPNVNPHSPIWHLGQEQLDVPAETWAREVLTPWQQAAAVTLVVKLPEGTATDDHRTVIRDLADARQRLDAGDWKGSIRASRDAAEVLRAMHDEHLNPKKPQRDVDEREAAILDAERQLSSPCSTTGRQPTLTRSCDPRSGPGSTPCLSWPPRPPSPSASSQPRLPGNHSGRLPHQEERDCGVTSAQCASSGADSPRMEAVEGRMRWTTGALVFDVALRVGVGRGWSWRTGR